MRASPAGPVRPLGTLGYLSCLAFSLLVGAGSHGWAAAPACAAILLLALAFYRAGLRPLASGRLWLLIGLIVTPASLGGGAPAWSVARITTSQQGLATGLQVALRAVAIVVAVSGFAASVPVSELAGLFERMGLRGLGFSLGVAINMLPVVRQTMITAWEALGMRGGFRRHRLYALRLLLVTVMANSLRHTGDIVNAAEARAFSVERTQPLPVRVGRADLALSGLLLASLILLFLAC